MKTLYFLLLAGLCTGCHLDALLKGAGGGGAGSSPGAPQDRLTFTTQPSQATAGQAIGPVQVAVVDSAGQPVTAFTGTVTIALNNPGGASLSGTAAMAAVSGLATFSDLTIDKSGRYTLRASASDAVAATSTPIDVIPPPPPPPGVTHLGFVRQPLPTAEAGSVLSPVQVAAFDASGNVVSGFTSVVTVALGASVPGATLSGTLSLGAVSGVATFSNLSIDNAGTGYTLQASAPGLAATPSAPLDVTAAPPPPGGAAYLRFTDQPQITQAGQSMPAVRVTVYDAGNNQVRSFTGNVTTTIESTPSVGTLTTAAPTSDKHLAQAGVVQWTDLSTDQPGYGYTLRATSPGLQTTVSDPFDVTADPPPPLNGATGLAFYQEPTTTRAGDVFIPPIKVGVQSGGSIDPNYSPG